MFLCICNAHRSEDVRLAGLANQSASVEEVYAALGGPPRCGRCLPHAREMLQQSREECTATRCCRDAAPLEAA